MVIEENAARVYHTFENSRDYKEFDLKFVECDLSAIPAFQFLLQAHPQFIPIEELPLETLEDKVSELRFKRTNKNYVYCRTRNFFL